MLLFFLSMWLSFSSLRFTVSLSIRSGSDAKHDTQLFMKVYGISEPRHLTDTESHSVHWICSLRALFSCVHFDCLSVCVFVCVCYFCLCFRSTGNTFVLSSNGTLYFVGWYWNQGLRIKCNTFAKCIMSWVFGIFFFESVRQRHFAAKCVAFTSYISKRKNQFYVPLSISVTRIVRNVHLIYLTFDKTILAICNTIMSFCHSVILLLN